jgi:hypothetical protein
MRLIQILILSVLLMSCLRAPLRPGYPVTVRAAQESTFMVEKAFDGVPVASGTAWIVDKDGTFTYLMTAGHVCAGTATRLDGSGSVMISYRLTSKDDVTMPALVLKAEQDVDLCLLMAPGSLGEPLLLAEKMPEHGAPVTYVGAPMGFYGQGLAPVYDGRYLGNRFVGVPTIGGASGSALFTADGVFGVLVTVDQRYHHMVGFRHIYEIKDFLYRQGFKTKEYEPYHRAVQAAKQETETKTTETH